MLRKTLRPVAHLIRSVIGTAGIAERMSALEAAMRQPVTPPPASAPETPPLDVNLVLHHSRGAFLRGMPPGAQRLLSAGCAGLWYFDWIEQTYGHVAEHLGIEYYTPMPEGLPGNVTWIANTASDMSSVDGGSCDLVFSGQNLEHLWPEEIAGFLLESARVLRPGGHLVIDSPNRLITGPLNWSHPEHTIELTPAEATALMRLAGFDVTACHGIWLCRDARTGAVLPFDPNQNAPGWSLPERLLLARDRPDDSFIWWIEGVLTDRVPDGPALHAAMAELFRQHWPERVQRLLVPPGHGSVPSADGEWIESAPGQGGVALYGPYMPLRAGRYRVTWQVRPAAGARTSVAYCEILAAGNPEPLARHDVLTGESRVSLDFDLNGMTFGLQFRCVSTGGEGFSVLRKVELEEHIR